MHWGGLVLGLGPLVYAWLVLQVLQRQHFDASSVLDAARLNLSLMLVLFMFNLETITDFNALFFNGTDPWTAYNQTVVNRDDYSRWSDFFFLWYLTCVALSLLTVGIYVYRLWRQQQQQQTTNYSLTTTSSIPFSTPSSTRPGTASPSSSSSSSSATPLVKPSPPLNSRP